MITVTTEAAEMTKSLLGELTKSLGPYLSSIDTYTTTPAGLATPATVTPNAATAAGMLEIDKSHRFFRPSGEEYLPRKMVIAGEPTTDVAMVKAAALTKNPVLLYGPPGTGKTALIEAAMNDTVTIQGTIETETADFVGSWVQEPDGTYAWVDGPLAVAVEQGRPLFIDEIALIDPRSLAVVYGVMDGRDELVVTQNPKRGTIKVAPGFVVMGAFNPNVPGAILSDALISRFPVQVEMTTDWSLASKMGCSTQMINVVRNLNKKAESGEITAAPQLRELLAHKRLSETFGETFALSNFFGQIRPENREVVKQVIESVFGVKPVALSI